MNTGALRRGASWGVRTGLRAGVRHLGGRAAPEPEVLQRRLRAVEDWQRDDDGRARRLTPEETIAVTRKGRWGERDPLAVAVGWWPPRRAAGLATWAAAVGLGWWAGRHGHGPLRTLAVPDERR